MSHVLTIEQFGKVLPPQVKKSLNQTLIDEINAIISDPIVAENVRDNILGYAHIMETGRFKLTDYVNAVRYCSFKFMGDTNIAAYVKAFPDRYQTFVNNGTSEKDIASYVTAYNKNKLVTLIMEQALVPVHILNQDLYQKAINHQATLMLHAKSETVQQKAAECLMTNLRPPETTKIEMDIKHTESSAISELRAATMELVAQQRLSIQAGANTAQQIAHSKVIEGECEGISDAS